MLLTSLVLASCGSGSSSTSTTSAPVAGAGAEAPPPQRSKRAETPRPPRQAGKPVEKQAGPQEEEAVFTPKPHHDSGGGAGQLEEKGGDNSIQRFGAEPSAAEFAQAAADLHDYLDARAAGAWGDACSYMTKAVAKGLAQLAANRSASCAKLLEGLSAGLPPQALREAAIADARALRAEGARAFLLFTGAHGVSYFIPMAAEGGRWKVAALAPSQLGGP